MLQSGKLKLWIQWSGKREPNAGAKAVRLNSKWNRDVDKCIKEDNITRIRIKWQKQIIIVHSVFSTASSWGRFFKRNGIIKLWFPYFFIAFLSLLIYSGTKSFSIASQSACRNICIVVGPFIRVLSVWWLLFHARSSQTLEVLLQMILYCWIFSCNNLN